MLAASCRAGGIDESHVFTRLSNSASVMTADDVKEMFIALDKKPAARGFVAAVMSLHIQRLKNKDASVLEFVQDPLFIRLRDPETFRWLLELHASDHDECLRANTLYDHRCETLRLEIANVVAMLVAQADMVAFPGSHKQETLAIKKLMSSGFAALVKFHEKEEEPLGREESKSDDPPAAPEGYEIVARVLEHLGEPHLLPIFEAEEINDNVLPVLDPADLIGLGVSQMTCLTMLGAAHSAAKNKKLETEDVLDNVVKHQSVLEEALREHRAEIAALRIRELPEDLCCPITCEIMKDPVLCVEDGHTYERVAIEQWFATGARTSPSTSAQLESTALAPNHMARKLIAALLEQHGGGGRGTCRHGA